jgi:uncharacterized FlaG/YvyC family protein
MDPVLLTQGAVVTAPTKPVPREGAGGGPEVEPAPQSSTPAPERERQTAPGGSDQSRMEERIRAESARLFKGTELEFEFEERNNRVVVRVFDKESGRLLREIPPGEVTELSRSTRQGKGRLISRAV